MFKYKTNLKRGQSTVEYIVLATAVIAVIILFVASPNGGFQGQLNNVIATSANRIESKGSTLTDSYDHSVDKAAPTLPAGSPIAVDPSRVSGQ